MKHGMASFDSFECIKNPITIRKRRALSYLFSLCTFFVLIEEPFTLCVNIRCGERKAEKAFEEIEISIEFQTMRP